MSYLVVCLLATFHSVALSAVVASPFRIGDTWRGHLSQCEKRVFPGSDSAPHVIDMTVQSISTDGIIDVLFTEQTTKTQYIMTGSFDSTTLELELKFSGEWIHKDMGGWVPCDARGIVSKDFSTLTGDSMCKYGSGANGAKRSCPYAGGGEFILRHDRTKFNVLGAGDKSVNGVYSSVPKNHDLFDSETYEGVPIYKQVSCESEGCRNHHVLAQRKIGSQKFWIITDINSLGEHQPNAFLQLDEHEAESAAVFDTVKYSAWSEEVTPPLSGWRKRSHFESRQPAPNVEPVVSTMFELQQMAHPMHRGIEDGVGSKFVVGKGESSYGLVGSILIFLVAGFVVLQVCGRKKVVKSPHSRYQGIGGGGNIYSSV